MNTGTSVLRLPPLDGEGLRGGWATYSEVVPGDGAALSRGYAA